jgi:O-antigen/teichoic acid export membrane protein
MGSSLIAIPIVIIELNVEEINVWLLLAALSGISQGIIFGFNSTFVRFIAYSYSGIKINRFRGVRYEKSASFSEHIDIVELSKIMNVMTRTYLFLALFYFLFILIVGYYSLKNPVAALDNPAEAWIAFAIVVLTTSLTFFLGLYQVFMEGIGKVALVQRLLGIVNLFGLPVILVVLLISPELLYIVGVYQLVSVTSMLCLSWFGIKEKRRLGIENADFDREVFILVWESAWKTGLTGLSGNFLRHGSAILIAQLFPPSQSASFLFTKRLFDILERFTGTTFQAKIPEMAKYRGRGDLAKLIPLIMRTQYICYCFFLAGYILLLIFGDQILQLIGSNVDLSGFVLIILFSLTSFFSRWATMTLAISTQANHVVEHLSAGIYLLAYVFILVILLNLLNAGVDSFLWAQLGAILLSIGVVINVAYHTLFTSFLVYEKKVLLPMFGALVLVNGVYYHLNIS